MGHHFGLNARGRNIIMLDRLSLDRDEAISLLKTRSGTGLGPGVNSTCARLAETGVD
jgi:hypothetical protein